MKRSTRAGYAALLIAVVIWAAWLPATRLAVRDGFSPVEVAFLRYSVPALILAPLWWGLWPKLKRAPLWTLVTLMGWGAPFVLGVSAGLQNASVAHASALIPCVMPLIAVSAERLFFKTQIERYQLPGFALIGTGALIVLLIALFGDSPTAPISVFILICAAAGWAAFTVAFKRSGLTPLEVACYVPAVSTLLVLPFLLVSGDAYAGFSWGAIAFHAVAQGLFSGLVATLAYAIGISRLGAARSAAFSVLVPALAAVIGWFWLGESLTQLDVLALGLGCAGVALVNGALRRDHWI